MYLRAVHAETNVTAVQQFVRANPLDIFTTAIDSKSYPFLQSSHVSLVLDVDETGTGLGVLRGHLASESPNRSAPI